MNKDQINLLDEMNDIMKEILDHKLLDKSMANKKKIQELQQRLDKIREQL